MTIEHELLTSIEAAAFLRYEKPDGTPNPRALYAGIGPLGIPVCRRGRRMLFDKDDLRAWLRDNSMMRPTSTVLRAARRGRSG